MINLNNEKDIYWNPLVETLPLEKLRELQVKKFKRILEWAYETVEIPPKALPGGRVEA